MGARRRGIEVVIAAALVVLVALSSLMAACDAATKPVPRWPQTFAFYSHAGGTELQRLRQVGSCLDVLAPNWYGLDVATQSVAYRSPDPDVMALSREEGFAVWPVVNAQTRGSAAMDDPQARAAIANAIANLATAHGYQGMTIDIEGMSPAQRDAFSSLVQDLADRLHADGRGLAVYVPRRTAQPPNNTAAPYDWNALASAADLLLASGYNEHYRAGPPGPITTTSAFRAMVGYARSISPRIAPTLGAFGYSWPKSGGPGTLVSSVQAAADLRALGVRSRLSDGERTYQTPTQTVWYETAQGLRSRMGIAAKAGLPWIGLFSLGREEIGFWAGCGRQAARG